MPSSGRLSRGWDEKDLSMLPAQQHGSLTRLADMRGVIHHLRVWTSRSGCCSCRSSLTCAGYVRKLEAAR